MISIYIDLETYQRLLNSEIVQNYFEEEFKISQSILKLKEEKIKLQSSKNKTNVKSKRKNQIFKCATKKW